MRLSDDALARKLRAARGYAELADEVDHQIDRFGDDVFRTERLTVANARSIHPPVETPPFYERHGERRVSAGRYDAVIRYGAHVYPLARALWQSVPR